MMIWFVDDPARLAQEKSALQALQGSVHWLKGVNWRIGKHNLLVDANIEAHEHIYSVCMSYPSIFPDSPPSVTPSEEEENRRWSSHQYWPTGELCLEWGPDNWLPEITGAQILESVYRLLETENPKGRTVDEIAVIAQSRHALTTGQSMRTSIFRFLLSAELQTHLSSLPDGALGELEGISCLWQENILTSMLVKLQTNGETSWEESCLPSRLKSLATKRSGIYLSTELSSSSLQVDSLESLSKVIEPYPSFQSMLMSMDKTSLDLILVRDNTNKGHLFHLSTNKTDVISYDVVNLPEPLPAERLGSLYEALTTKRVGIVGLGSAGSKIAETLARSGVQQFLLVDDDLFLPENMVRHTLDWRNIGEHKAAAVASQLKLISPNIKADVSRIRLTGQESNATLAGSLEALSRCDLIFDATADAKTFNLLARLAKQFEKPLIWLEIYGGGIGGLIARYRPTKDPTPQIMRTLLNAHLSSLDVSLPQSGDLPYSIETAQEGSSPVVATDTDVGIIAYHSVRMALDILSEHEPSAFPYSMYLIGLTRAWIFKAPFHTIPFDTGLPLAEESDITSDEQIAEGKRFFVQLFREASDGTTDSLED